MSQVIKSMPTNKKFRDNYDRVFRNNISADKKLLMSLSKRGYGKTFKCSKKDIEYQFGSETIDETIDWGECKTLNNDPHFGG